MVKLNAFICTLLYILYSNAFIDVVCIICVACFDLDSYRMRYVLFSTMSESWWRAWEKQTKSLNTSMCSIWTLFTSNVYIYIGMYSFFIFFPHSWSWTLNVVRVVSMKVFLHYFWAIFLNLSLSISFSISLTIFNYFLFSPFTVLFYAIRTESRISASCMRRAVYEVIGTGTSA